MWISKGGNPLSDEVIAKVNLDLLAAAYAAETDGRDLPAMDSATFLAWRYGYLNPRTS